MKKEYDIFISYRREGGKEYARNLTSELVSRGFHPFLDFDELKDGKFDKRITDAIESAPVFMFILSPGSLDRCVNEDDWVRKEILHAIEHKRHIVPVDIDKQFDAFPSVDDFPQEIKNALGQHQFSQIQTETLYKVSIDEMVRNRIQPAIDEYMREKQKAAGMTGAEIHIETDMDCHVQRFHRDMIIAKVDEENVIHLPKGKHKLQFISVENPDVKDSCEYKVEDVTESDFIEVVLQEKAGVIYAEIEERDRLQQEREKLAAEVESLTLQLSKAASDYDTLSLTSSESIQSLKREKLCLLEQIDKAHMHIEEKTKKTEILEKRLNETQHKLDVVEKDFEDSMYMLMEERKAKEELERQAEEVKKLRDLEELGDFYYFVDSYYKGLKTNSIYWYRKAAEQGDVHAQTKLATLYWIGDTVQKDESQAFSWFKKATEGGNVHAQLGLAACYCYGQGVPEDESQAFSWIKKAAEQDNTLAQLALGACYMNGVGVAKEQSQAFQWIKKAAEKGVVEAQYVLADFYKEGEGVPQDVSLALNWYQKAAERGYCVAQYELAVFYENGEVVPKDITKALELYQKAAEQDYSEAKEALSRLNEKIREEEARRTEEEYIELEFMDEVLEEEDSHKTEEDAECEIFEVGNVEFKMIYVEGGTFTMGEGSDAHQVTLSPYYIGETPVTQALWTVVMGSNPSRLQGDQRPVVFVSWNDCQEFIKKLNAKTGKKFRLLTEAEWEYAARGGNKSKGYEYAGSNNINDVAWYDKNAYDKGSSSPDYGTHPVKQKKPNELGIYDMSGNVWEWCQDWYGNYKKGAQTNPTGPTSASRRVARGGCWGYDAEYCRLSYRGNCSPDGTTYYLGLRLALSK